jgi:protein-disulfide isomerase
MQIWAADAVPIAVIGKSTVSMQELTDRMAGHMAEQQQAYEKSLLQMKLNHEREQHAYREQELRAIVDEKVLALEAASRKTTPAVLMAVMQKPSVTDEEARKFYDSNKEQIAQPFAQVEPMIKEYLAKQSAESAKEAYFANLRAKYKASITLEPFREPVLALGPSRGPPNALVTIVEFSDFECPFCGRYSPVIKEVMDQYPTQIRLVYRHLPLTSLHPNAQKAAEAAICAQDQGKFWEMHDLLFAEQKSLGLDALKEKAKRLGLDARTFEDCLASGKSKETVIRDTEAAEQLGLGGTPASFVNGRYLNGAVPKAMLTSIITDELRRAGKPGAR